MGEIFLYHGSAGIIKAPVYGKGNGFNDYGCGFYCTGDKELAKEWACAGGTAAFVNIYELNTEGLRILDLASGYTLLYHIALLAEYRRFRILTSGIQSAVTWIKEHFRIELAGYTQSGLAEQSGLNIKTLQSYEIRGKNINRAAAESLMMLARTLGCRIEDLMEYGYDVRE